MSKIAILFEDLEQICPHFNSDVEINGGYGCNHPKQEEKEEKNEVEYGCCYCFSCPLGVEAEQQDLTNPNHPDAIEDTINWNGLCEDGEVPEGEILLINDGETSNKEEKEILQLLDMYYHRYDA